MYVAFHEVKGYNNSDYEVCWGGGGLYVVSNWITEQVIKKKTRNYGIMPLAQFFQSIPEGLLCIEYPCHLNDYF
jgi:hypothetical protein